ncbi:hypothetical protein MRX96_010306 [Rhipicephalus microplus]
MDTAVYVTTKSVAKHLSYCSLGFPAAVFFFATSSRLQLSDISSEACTYAFLSCKLVYDLAFVGEIADFLE